MKINGKSTQGIFAYSSNYEYERGDFVIYKETLYKCIAEKDTVVCNSIPSEDRENFEEYPGNRIRRKEDYEKELSEGIDSYVSSDLLNQILSDTYFGMNESGIISSSISYEDGNVSYSVRDLNGDYKYGEEPGILDTMICDNSLNNGAVKISTSLPDIETLLPPKSTKESFGGYILTGQVVDSGTGEGVEGVLVSEIVYYVAESDSYGRKTGEEVYTDASGSFVIPISSDTSRLKISGPAPYEKRFFDIPADGPTLYRDEETGVVVIPNPIKIQKEGVFYSVKGKVSDSQGNSLEGVTVSVDNSGAASWVKLRYNKPLSITEENTVIGRYVKSTANPEDDNSRKSAIQKSIRENCLYYDESKSYGIFKFKDDVTSIVSPTKFSDRQAVNIAINTEKKPFGGPGSFKTVPNSLYVYQYVGSNIDLGTSITLDKDCKIYCEENVLELSNLEFLNGYNSQATLDNDKIGSVQIDVVLRKGSTTFTLWTTYFSYGNKTGGKILKPTAEAVRGIPIDSGTYYLEAKIGNSGYIACMPVEIPNINNMRGSIALKGVEQENTVVIYKAEKTENDSVGSSGFESFVADALAWDFASKVDYGAFTKNAISTKTDKDGLFTLESTSPILGVSVEDIKNNTEENTTVEEGEEGTTITTEVITLITTDTYRAKYVRAVSDFLDIKLLTKLPDEIMFNIPCPGRLLLSNTEDFYSDTLYNETSGIHCIYKGVEEDGALISETTEGTLQINLNPETVEGVDFTKPVFLSYFIDEEEESSVEEKPSEEEPEEPEETGGEEPETNEEPETGEEVEEGETEGEEGPETGEEAEEEETTEDNIPKFASIVSSRVLQTSAALIGESFGINISLEKQDESSDASVSFENNWSNIAGVMFTSKYYYDNYESTTSEDMVIVSEDETVIVDQGHYKEDLRLIIVAREGYKGGIYNVIDSIDSTDAYPVPPLSDSYGYQKSVVDVNRQLGHIILRQFTYFDDTKKVYTRVQEIADPQYGNLVYRFARTPGDNLDFTNAVVSSWRSATNGNMPAREKLISLENLYTRKCSELDSLKKSLKESYCISYLPINEDGKVLLDKAQYPELSEIMLVTLLVKEDKGNGVFKTYSITFDVVDGSAQYMIGSSIDAAVNVVENEENIEINVDNAGFTIGCAQYRKKFN